MSSHENSPEIDNRELYYGWMLAAKLAEWHGMQVGVWEDPERVGILTFKIELPSGAVLVDIPSKYVDGYWRHLEGKPHADIEVSRKAVMDCFLGTLIHKHILVVPQEKEEETE